MNKEKNLKALSVKFPVSLHDKLKVYALTKGVTMNNVVIEAVKEKVKDMTAGDLKNIFE